MGGMHYPGLYFVDTQPSPEEVSEAQDLHHLITAALNTLSPKNRQATWLFYYQSLSITEIATLLGISISAVKGRLHKSRQALRPALETLQVDFQPPTPCKNRSLTMVKVTVADIVMKKDEGKEFQIIILWDDAGQRVLLIWISPSSAESMAYNLLEQENPPPPNLYLYG